MYVYVYIWMRSSSSATVDILLKCALRIVSTICTYVNINIHMYMYTCEYIWIYLRICVYMRVLINMYRWGKAQDLWLKSKEPCTYAKEPYSAYTHIKCTCVLIFLCIYTALWHMCGAFLSMYSGHLIYGFHGLYSVWARFGNRLDYISLSIYMYIYVSACIYIQSRSPVQDLPGLADSRFSRGWSICGNASYACSSIGQSLRFFSISGSGARFCEWWAGV